MSKKQETEEQDTSDEKSEAEGHEAEEQGDDHADAHAEGHDDHGGHDDHDDHDEPAAEEDRPRVLWIGGSVVATVALIVAIVVGMNEVYRQLFTAEVDAKINSLQSTELRDLHAQEETKLSHYQWVSKADGVVRVPLARAIDLTLADYRRPVPPTPPAPPAPPPPAPSGSPSAVPAPSGSAHAPPLPILPPTPR